MEVVKLHESMADGSAVLEGIMVKTVNVTETFIVRVRAGHSVSAETIKNLIQTRHEVLSIIHTETHRVMEAVAPELPYNGAYDLTQKPTNWLVDQIGATQDLMRSSDRQGSLYRYAKIDQAAVLKELQARW